MNFKKCPEEKTALDGDVQMEKEVLYHYSGNIKCFSILSNKNIRLSDIRKSNDTAELQIFYPAIIYAIEDEYKKDPFDFKYERHTNSEAVSVLLKSIKETIETAFDEGKLTSFVLCLSEEGDLLSQWRGYADNGKGCSIGFDKEELQKFCDSSKEVFKLEKIQYLTKEKTDALIREKAKTLKERLLYHYNNYKEHFPKQPVRIFSGLLFDIIDEIGKTIIYKSVGFSEEKEWRLYTNDWLSKSFAGYRVGKLRGEVANYLENKILYHITEDDMVPFTLFEFDNEPSKYIDRIILGPANKIALKDMKNFLKENNYTNTQIIASRITYK